MYLTNLKLKDKDLPTKIPENISNEVTGVIDQIKAIEREHQKQQQHQQQQQQQQQQSQIQRNMSPQVMLSPQQQYTGMSEGHTMVQYPSTNQPGIQNSPIMPG